MTLPTNRNLEQLFNLPPSEQDTDDDQQSTDSVPAMPATPETLAALDDTINKVESALPAVRGLEMADSELDDLAQLAITGYRDLTELGMQVDSRFASEIFSVASNMLGHAISARTAKLDKKLKMVDLQLKKIRLDQQQQVIDNRPGAEPPAGTQQGEGVVVSRNDLLDRLLASSRASQKGSNE